MIFWREGPTEMRMSIYETFAEHEIGQELKAVSEWPGLRVARIGRVAQATQDRLQKTANA